MVSCVARATFRTSHHRVRSERADHPGSSADRPCTASPSGPRLKIRLHQTFGAHAGRTRELDQDVITFGRLPSSDVAFDPHADLDASGSHAEIRREGAVWVLRDVGSRNGTLVAGRPIQRHELSDGDEIEFGTGGPRVRVELVASLAQPGPKPMGTMAATPILEPALPAMGAAHSPPPTVPPPADKKYGQATLDAAVEAAAAKARAEALADAQRPKGTALLPQSQLPQPVTPIPSSSPGAYVAPVAPTAPVGPAGETSQSTLWMIGGIVALFVFLTLCLISCVLLGYLYRYG
jgi:pSer/pThr/pTyr-binding forkhead associated (FHA) protein